MVRADAQYICHYIGTIMWVTKGLNVMSFRISRSIRQNDGVTANLASIVVQSLHSLPEGCVTKDSIDVDLLTRGRLGHVRRYWRGWNLLPNDDLSALAAA